MSSQYDTIGEKYSVFKEMATSIMEEENVKKAVMPYLSKTQNARVLDLASGTGHYSRKAIDWGAAYVLGVDSSREMVSAARSLQPPAAGDGMRFEVGDVLSLGRIEGEEPFDVVLGAWLLNYAAGLDEITGMFRTIAANLKDGGVFVGLAPSAAEDVDALAAHWREACAKLPESFPIRVDYYEKLASGEGWKTEVSNKAGGERVSFRNFHLRKSLYEKGARRAGLGGRLDWPEVEIPERVRDELDREGWKTYVEGGKNMSVLVIEKRLEV